MADLHLDLEQPQVYLAVAKGGSDGYMPILPALAQELRTYLSGRKTTYLFESNRRTRYSPRAIQLVVRDAAKQAGLETSVTPLTGKYRYAVARRGDAHRPGADVPALQERRHHADLCRDKRCQPGRKLLQGPVEVTLKRPLFTRVTGRIRV